MQDELLDQKQFQAEYGTSIRGQEAWRRRNTGPKYIKLGAQIRYRRSDIERWLESRAVDPSDAA